LQEQAFGGAALHPEVGLQFLGHLAAIGRVGEDDPVFAFLGHVVAVYFKGVG